VKNNEIYHFSVRKRHNEKYWKLLNNTGLGTSGKKSSGGLTLT
jgi:hypothetical protein